MLTPMRAILAMVFMAMALFLAVPAVVCADAVAGRASGRVSAASRKRTRNFSNIAFLC